MKIPRLLLIIILLLPLITYLGYPPATCISKERSAGKNTLFLVYSYTIDPIGLVDVLVKKIRLMGYEAQNLSPPPGKRRNKEKNQSVYGSGFFISESGLFITACHVIERAETIILKKLNGDSSRAEIFIDDPLTDIAILSTTDKKKEDHWLSLGNYHNANIGDEVKAIGYPVPNLVGSIPKLTTGFISPDVGLQGDPTKFAVRAPLVLGYSGAAILNTRNEVIGIASEQISDFTFLTHTGPLPPDINLGIKIDYARTLLEISLEENMSWKNSNIINLEDAINSTALVLVNTREVPEDFQSKKPGRSILVDISNIYGYYIIHYTLFEFNRKWTAKDTCEVLASEYIAGAPGSDPYELVEEIIKEMRIKVAL